VAAAELMEEGSITEIDWNVTSLEGRPVLHSPSPVNSKRKESEAHESEHHEKWNTRFMELEEYEGMNGHCNCPTTNGPLGSWVSYQRTFFRSKKLKVDRYEKLMGIGFVFENARFETKSGREQLNNCFMELVKYKEKNGHCSIPTSKGSFENWISRQKTLFRSKEVKADRYEKLVGIGFA